MLRERGAIVVSQALLLAALLLAWQYLPQWHVLASRSHVFDPFFVSSPSRIGERLWNLARGGNGSVEVWPYLWPTLQASLAGTAIGMTLGALAGLVFSSFRFVSSVMQPFLIAANSVPRVALIPIVVILVGPKLEATVILAVMVVFFTAFFNAYEGGVTVAPQLIQNAEILGASQRQVMLRIRLPYVVAWTLAVLPLGITFAILTVVTAELFTGGLGMGRLLYNASVATDSTQTFAVVVILGVLGIVVVAAANLFKRRVLHWWGRG